MKTNTKHYAIALYQALKETKASENQTILENFVNLLAEKHILSQARQIIKDFKKYYNQQEGLIEVTVSSAEKISTAEEKQIAEEIKKTTHLKAEITNEVDPELIGGLKLEFADLVVDGSLKNSLNNLKTTLKS
ncbi:MAG: ATP synthase F1 subunit delta [Candidatus Buchananbacteria bacterium]|nr:ATP synthase F1 subunit delta [Candidatus Buchananbacteria bacterium]